MAVFASSGCIRITDGLRCFSQLLPSSDQDTPTRHWCSSVSLSEQLAEVGRCMLINLTAVQPSCHLPASCNMHVPALHKSLCRVQGPQPAVRPPVRLPHGLRDSRGEASLLLTHGKSYVALLPGVAHICPPLAIKPQLLALANKIIHLQPYSHASHTLVSCTAALLTCHSACGSAGHGYEALLDRANRLADGQFVGAR